MKTMQGMLLAGLAALAMAMAGCASEGSSSNIDRKTVDGLPSVTATGTSWADVKVEAVDYWDRAVALTGPDGKTHIFKVGPEVRNLNQLKKGDTVRVEYAEQLTVNVRKSNEPLSVDAMVALERSAVGSKPGMVATRIVETDTTVQRIDYDTRRVTFMGPDGNTFSLTASDKLKNLDKVKVGDRVVFTYAEAVSIQVKGS